MNNTQQFLVSEEKDCGIRIDKFLSEAANNTGLSRNAVMIMLEENNCLVNGKTVKKNYKTRLNDKITLTVPPPIEINISGENIPLDIAYEDVDLLVVNKSRGMVVHPSHGHYEKTLVNALMFHCRDSLSGINGELRPGIVHRIDKDTSGLLLVAKNDFAHISLARQIKEHSIKRCYEAVVSGNIKENGKIDASIARHRTDRKKMCVSDSPGARKAITHYEVIKNYKNASHLRLTLETGRTHQIRVHLNYIGHQVLGDFVYGNGKPKWLGGQCLHAKCLGFMHPRTGEYIEIESELPDYFNRLLKELT